MLDLLVQLLHSRHDLAHLSCIVLILGGRLVDAGREDRDCLGMVAVGVGCYRSRLPLQLAAAETTS